MPRWRQPSRTDTEATDSLLQMSPADVALLPPPLLPLLTLTLLGALLLLSHRCRRRRTAARLVVFHDGENCYLSNARDLDAGLLVKRTVERITAVCGLRGPPSVVDWLMFLPKNEPERIRHHPTDAAVEALLNAGVTYVRVGSKSGAVDTALKDAVARFSRRERALAGSTLVAILSGDRDFAGDLRALRGEGFATALVSPPARTSSLLPLEKSRNLRADRPTREDACCRPRQPHANPTPPPGAPAADRGLARRRAERRLRPARVRGSSEPAGGGALLRETCL